MMTTADVLKVGLAFLNAFAGYLAQAPDVDPTVRAVSAALVAGCGMALLVLNPPGKAVPALTADEVAHVKAAVKSAKAVTNG